jgi:hypothetical protein
VQMLWQAKEGDRELAPMDSRAERHCVKTDFRFAKGGEYEWQNVALIRQS